MTAELFLHLLCNLPRHPRSWCEGGDKFFTEFASVYHWRIVWPGQQRVWLPCEAVGLEVEWNVDSFSSARVKAVVPPFDVIVR